MTPGEQMLRALRPHEPAFEITLALACQHLQNPAPYPSHGQRKNKQAVIGLFGHPCDQ
jgi:hypothetical protein